VGYQLWEPGKLNPLFNLYVAGYQVGDGLKRYVESIRISHRYQESMAVKVVIRDDKLQWTDLNIWNKGTEWAVALGSVDDFRPFGPLEVAGFKMTFNPQGYCQIDLDLMDKMRVLNQCARARSFEGKSIGQVVQQIAEENGLGFIIEDSDKHVFDDSFPAMQADWTDARFLRKIADRYGYYFAIQDGNIIFKQDQVNKDVLSPKILAWRVGTKSLMSFEPAQTTFIKKGGGTGAAGQSGPDVGTCGVDIAAGEAFGTNDTDDEFGVSDPNDTSMDDVVANTSGGAEEQSEAGDILATSDNSEEDQGAVTEPANEYMEALYETGTLQLGGKTIEDSAFVHTVRDVTVPQRDVGDTPDKKEDVPKVLPAAGAGTKSDLALAKAELTVFDVTVRQGDPVEVIGVGTRFSGRWRIYEYEHVLDAGGLKTTLWCGKKGLGPSSKTADAEDKAKDTQQDPSLRAEEAEQMWVGLAGDTSVAVLEGSGKLVYQRATSRK
jgi:hypothetical protein